MFDISVLKKMDFRLLIVLLFLMMISLLVISSMSAEGGEEHLFFTPYVKNQIEWFLLGFVVFFFFVAFDYRKFLQIHVFLYVVMILLLLGLFLASPIQSVHRWYRIAPLGISFQPSEYAKMALVISLSAFFERRHLALSSLSAFFQFLCIIGLPLFLISKQPDLGTALVLFPITLVLAFFAGIHKRSLQIVSTITLIGFCFGILFYSGVIPHETMKPFFTKFLKEYQYDRLNPESYHQKAATIAIAYGGMKGSGWKKSEFSSHKWLPASYTDSVFAAFSEEFGFLGVLFLLSLFYFLIHICFSQVHLVKNRFGRLLASGIAVYLAMNIMVNIAMMCGFLPISGVPLILITYGGSSVIITMAALGISQSIYTRRFNFS